MTQTENAAAKLICGRLETIARMETEISEELATINKRHENLSEIKARLEPEKAELEAALASLEPEPEKAKPICRYCGLPISRWNVSPTGWTHDGSKTPEAQAAHAKIGTWPRPRPELEEF